jgi:hypothetical protein
LRLTTPFFLLGLMFAGDSAFAQDRLQIVAPPFWTNGWRQASDHAGPGWRLTVLVPTEAPDRSTKNLVSITTSSGGSQSDGVARLIRAWGLHVNATCEKLTVVPPKPNTENGYNVGYAQFYCPKRRDTAEGSVDFVKAVASESQAYLIAVAQSTRPFTSEVPGAITFDDNKDTEHLVDWLKATSSYLSSVRVCGGPSAMEVKCSQ